MGNLLTILGFLINLITGICYVKIASIYDTNVDLAFEFNKTRLLNINFTNTKYIGYCMVFYEVPPCSSADRAVFRLSANVSSIIVLTLIVLFFNKSMTGNYSCYDRYNDHEQTLIMRTPDTPDKPAVLIKTCNNTSVPLNGSLTLLDGESFELSCTAHGYPTPSVRWIPRFDGYENILRSYHVSYKQKGTYACVAENAMNITATGEIVGRNNVTVFLDIRARPHPPKQAHVIADSLTENSVTIEWVPSENGDVSETFTLLWKEDNLPYRNAITIPSLKTSFYLQGLAPGKKYKVKLTAENIAGKSNGTDIVGFQTDTSAQVASIVGGAVGGCSGLVIVCALSFVIYRKNLMWRKKKPLQSNEYQDIITNIINKGPRKLLYIRIAGSVGECYKETGFHGRSNPTYIKDVPQEHEESYEYVANPKSKKRDVTPTQYDSRIYSN